MIICLGKNRGPSSIVLQDRAFESFRATGAVQLTINYFLLVQNASVDYPERSRRAFFCLLRLHGRSEPTLTAPVR